MKVAVCMYGLLRTFRTTAESLKKHILLPNEADLYIFSSDIVGQSIVPHGVDLNSYKLAHIDYVNVKSDMVGENINGQILYEVYGDFLKGETLFHYEKKKFDKDSEGILGNIISPPSRCFSMIYQISGAVRLALNSGIDYDILVLVRPDLAFYSVVDLGEISLKEVHIPFGGGQLNDGLNSVPSYQVMYYKNTFLGEMIQGNRHFFTDQFIVTSAEIMPRLASLYGKLTTYAEQGVPMHPETILYYEICYKTHKEVHIHQEWLYEIFRDNFEPIDNWIYITQRAEKAASAPILPDIELTRPSFLMRVKVKMKNLLKKFFWYTSVDYRMLCRIRELLERMTIENEQHHH